MGWNLDIHLTRCDDMCLVFSTHFGCKSFTCGREATGETSVATKTLPALISLEKSK